MPDPTQNTDPLPTWTTAPASVEELLDRARGLVEKGWCKGALARDSGSAAVSPCDSNACTVCIFGALDRGAVLDPLNTFSMAMQRLAQCRPDGVNTFNDAPTTTHADVLALFEKAKEMKQ